MRIIFICLVFLIQNSGWANDSESISYNFTHNCVTDIIIRKPPSVESSIFTKQGILWEALIKLTDKEAVRFENFTKENIGKKMKITYGSGIELDTLTPRIYGQLSSPFQIAGIDNREKLDSLKRNIIESEGPCGPNI